MAYLYKDTIEQYKKLKFLVYFRRSSADSEDRQIRSIPGQLLDVNDQLIERFHLNVIKPYFQESQSAFKEGRPDFNEMLRQIEAGEANGVIVWHANRIARNYGDGGRFVQILMDGKIKILMTCFGVFESNPRDLEYLMTEFTRATRDSGDKSEAVKRGNRIKFLEKKQWVGPAKPGYLNVLDPITKETKIEKDQERFPLLDKAIKLILYGNYTPMQALNKLNNEWKYRSRVTKRQGGKPMSKSGWYKLLSDPYLYGLMIRKEGEVMGNDPKMLTIDEYRRMQIIIGRNGRPHVTKHEFAFKEVLRCGECNGSITCEERWQIICPVCKTKFHKGKKTIGCPECETLIESMMKPKILHYIHYHCTKKIKKDCSQGSITLEKLEKRTDETLKKYEISDKFKDWAIEYLNELNNKETNDRELVRGNIKVAYDDCVKKLDNLLKLKISSQNTDGSVITNEEYTAQRKYLLQEKEALMHNMNGTDKRIDSWHELSVKTFNFACYARYHFAHGDLKTKTQILAALGSNLTINDRDILIDGQKHFFLIEKGKKDLEILAKKFEPIKWLELLSQTDLPDAFRSSWLGGQDSNLDKQIQSLLSYH